MNILILTHYFHPSPIISAFRMNAFARYMREAGHNVTVITDGVHPKSIEWHGCDVHYITDPIYPAYITKSYLEGFSGWTLRRVIQSILFRITLHPAYLEEFRFTQLAKK